MKYLVLKEGTLNGMALSSDKKDSIAVWPTDLDESNFDVVEVNLKTWRVSINPHLLAIKNTKKPLFSKKIVAPAPVELASNDITPKSGIFKRWFGA